MHVTSSAQMSCPPRPRRPSCSALLCTAPRFPPRFSSMPQAPTSSTISTPTPTAPAPMSSAPNPSLPPPDKYRGAVIEVSPPTQTSRASILSLASHAALHAL